MIVSPIRMQLTEDTRFARRATRESDGLNWLAPGVALSESGNPGLSSGALSGPLNGCGNPQRSQKGAD